jgi:agmatinase
MSADPAYDAGWHLTFGGGDLPPVALGAAAAVVLPVPLDRTTSYLAGTRHGPREILLASSQIELWDEELGVELLAPGICTLPEMRLPFGDLASALDEVTRVAEEIVTRDAYLIVLGGEHSITPAVVRAAVTRHPSFSVLQIDAHADLRDSYEGSRHSHACAIRRTLEHAPCTQVAIRSISKAEAAAAPSLPTTIFYDISMRQEAGWIDRIVDTLSDTVYITIDCDGLDPAIMPAVGTPEPGGLSWHELLALLRAVFTRRHVIGADLVELCPIPGLVAPNVLAARLVQKLVSYRLGLGQRP